MRILIADDHAVLREGLKQILAEEFPNAEFRETGTTQETLDCLHAGEWDVLLLDVFMPGRSGLEVLQHARDSQPSLPVLVLSSAPEEQLAVVEVRPDPDYRARLWYAEWCFWGAVVLAHWPGGADSLAEGQPCTGSKSR